jgi:threonine dehydrogenase-like Zn-dependent dehydrogenase
MKAIRLNRPGELELCKVPKPTPDEYEVVCRVETVSICGTDPHIIRGEFPGFWPKEFPLILGHEWAGVIEELGTSAAKFGWKKGDRVCAISHVGCGYCSMCMEGRYNLCLNYGRTELGHRQYGHYVQGAYAEYMCTSVKAIARIPEGMDFDVASGMDPLSIALHMTMRSELTPGDTVLINGSGSQGLMSLLCARALGAGRIIISGSGYRLEMARHMGAEIIDYHKEDVAACIKEMTGGLGVKRVLECTGTPQGMKNACMAVGKGGCISVISLPKDDIPLPVRRLVLDEIKVVGNRANPNTLGKSLPIALHCMDELKALITHRFPLEQYEQAFDVFNGRKDNSLRVLLKPQL